MTHIRNFREFDVYRLAFETAIEIHGFSSRFPREEIYSLTDQTRRGARSVCNDIAEAWRKRRYPAAFISKLSDAEAEAAEVQVCLEFAVRHEYLAESVFRRLDKAFENVIGKLVRMIDAPEKRVIKKKPRDE